MTTQQHWADPLDAGPVVLGAFYAAVPVKAPDQTTLQMELEGSLAESIARSSPGVDCWLMEIVCRCGQRYIYRTADDIPAESVTCDCGRSIIQYTEATP